jgi:cyclopropane fatty-acyl-phospholipid synthase-like methyltransferase
VTAAGWAAVAEALAVGPGMRLLDVGCGDGGFLSLAAARGAEVSGLDADPAAVARARRRVPTADVRTGVMEDLPWTDAGFDVVVGFNAFQYARDIDLALGEALRVLRPDGRLGVCKWGRAQDNELFRLAVAIGAGRPGALRTQDPVAEAMRRAGLRVRDRGEVPVALEVPDVAALAGATGATDEAAMAEQASPHRRPDGSYRFAATLAYVVAAV